MALASVHLRIYGAENARGAMTNFRVKTRDRIIETLQREFPYSVENIRDVVASAYPLGTGKTASGIGGKIERTGEGAAARITIKNWRHVRYLTTLVPNSDFRAGPYPIYPSEDNESGRLIFFWKKEGRMFVGKPGQGVIHPGFGYDVIRMASETELARLGYIVEATVRSAIAEVQSGGSRQRVSGRR